jgi:hypothetical protein
MTVIATMLAGLASSEMTRAQYDRALAAQQQSKAGDQWSFFQAKRLRGAVQQNTYELLQATTEVHPFTPARALDLAGKVTGSQAQSGLQELKSILTAEENRAALEQFERIELKLPPSGTAMTEPIKTAIAAVENSRPDSELAEALSAIDAKALEAALEDGRIYVKNLDNASQPVNQLISKLEKVLNQFTPMGDGKVESTDPAVSLRRDFTATRLRFTAQRYEAEARANQNIAGLYELQVRKSNISASRHHARSQRFFYGMLAAQAAVIIATFAIAARQRNLLWSLAAAAGVAAIALAIYVYVFV